VPTGAQKAGSRPHTATRHPKGPHSGTWRAVRGVQKWVARLSPGEQSKFVEGLPVFLWGLDALTE